MSTTTNAERLALADRLEASVTHEGAPVYPYGDGRLRKLIVSAVDALRAQPAETGVREKEIIERCAQVCESTDDLYRNSKARRHAYGKEFAAAIRALNVAPPGEDGK